MSNRSVRPPAVAGMFYPADPQQCADLARSYLQPAARGGSPKPWGGALVPHAGWICSGAIAGEAIATMAESWRATIGSAARKRAPDVVVIFGAIHTPIEIGAAVLSSHAAWAEPTGESAVREDVGRRLSEKTNVFITDDRFHRHEHAVEVELPLIQSAFPQASILPVEVPVVEEAGEIGREVARQAKNAGLEAVFLASSDLTHYGPSYRFAPAGVGINGLNWAKENDRRLIDLVLQRAIERIVPEVRKNYNACGGGAIAAMLAACDELGADSSELLKHASSFETLAKVAPQQPADAVGYAGVVIG